MIGVRRLFGNFLDLHVAVLDLPLVVLLQEDGADEAGNAGLVREDADDVGPAFDLLVESFERIGCVEFGAVPRGEGLVGKHVGSLSISVAGLGSGHGAGRRRGARLTRASRIGG